METPRRTNVQIWKQIVGLLTELNFGVSTYAIAKELKMSYRTAYKHLRHLEKYGKAYCKKEYKDSMARFNETAFDQHRRLEKQTPIRILWFVNKERVNVSPYLDS